MMSGSVLAPWAFQPKPKENAKILAKSLSCSTETSEQIFECLQVNAVKIFI